MISNFIIARVALYSNNLSRKEVGVLSQNALPPRIKTPMFTSPKSNNHQNKNAAKTQKSKEVIIEKYKILTYAGC